MRKLEMTPLLLDMNNKLEASDVSNFFDMKGTSDMRKTPLTPVGKHLIHKIQRISVIDLHCSHQTRVINIMIDKCGPGLHAS